MTDHTPGPWKINHRQTKHGNWPVAAPDGEWIAEVKRGGPDERLANARLIAAAPDLLAALGAILSVTIFYSKCDDTAISAIEQAHTAIAKATS